MLNGRVNTLFIGLLIVALPLTRFLWDIWSQYLLYISVLCILTIVTAKSLLSENMIVIPEFPKSILIFIFCFVISAFLSPFKESARIQSLNLFSTIAVFLISRQLDFDSKLFLQKVIFAASSIFSLLFITANLKGVIPDPGDSLEFFLNTNLVASFTIIGLFISINCFKNSELLTAVLSVPIFVAFFWTKSLAAYLGAGIGLTYIFRKRESPPVFKKTTFGLCITLLLGSAILIFTQGIERSLFDRFHWWSAGIQSVLSHPLFGCGPGSFEKLAAFHSDPGKLNSIYVHNFPLQIASELGLFAFVSLSLFFIWLFRTMENSYLKAGLLAIVFQNLFDFSLNLPGFFLLTIMVCALAIPPHSPLKINISRNGSLFSSILIFILILFSGWMWGIKPLMAINESLNADESFTKMNLRLAEKHLRKSLEWDDVPSKTHADLSAILIHRYHAEGADAQLIREATRLIEESITRDPYSKEYRIRMNVIQQLLGVYPETPKNPLQNNVSLLKGLKEIRY